MSTDDDDLSHEQRLLRDNARRFLAAEVSPRVGEFEKRGEFDWTLPARLRDCAIPREALPELARQAMGQQRLLQNNPRPVDEADALAIYEAAW